MQPEDDALLRKAIARLNSRLLGVVLGLIMGFALFLATVILVLKGGSVVGPHLALLSQFFPGYRVTFFGSILGFFYGFITGFLIGAVLGIVYNQIAST
ncbi:MAG: bacteriophage holin [Candidatus Acidiferrales bacterium]